MKQSKEAREPEMEVPHRNPKAKSCGNFYGDRAMETSRFDLKIADLNSNLTFNGVKTKNLRRGEVRGISQTLFPDCLLSKHGEEFRLPPRVSP